MIDIDTSMMAYDINAEDFVDKISSSIPAFRNFQDPLKKQIFQWVVLMYDFHSPTRRAIKEYHFRKAYCANLVGFTVSKETGTFDKEVESFLIGMNDNVNKLQVAYIASFSSPEYTQLCGFLAMQYSVMMEIVKGASDTQITKNLSNLTTEISALTKLLYGSGVVEEIQQARKALYAQAGEDLRKLRPEAVVEMLEKEGKLPDTWGPYGTYIPSQMTFAGDDHTIEDE